jgi:hypothetical protein
MVGDGNDFDEVGSLDVNDAEGKPVQEISAKALMYSRPAPRRFGNARNGGVQFEAKRICDDRIAREIPAP